MFKLGLLAYSEDGTLKQVDQGNWISTYGMKENTQSREYKSEDTLSGAQLIPAGTSVTVKTCIPNRRYYLDYIFLYCDNRSGQVHLQDGAGNTIINTYVTMGVPTEIPLTTPIPFSVNIIIQVTAGGADWNQLTWTLNGYDL